MQPEKTFHLAFLDADILLYVYLLLAVAVAACLITRRRVLRRNVRLLIYVCSLLFAVSVLLPTFAPMWTDVRITGSHLRIEGLTFDSEIKLAVIDRKSAVVLHRLPDSLNIKRPRGGVSFSDLSFGWFMLKNDRPALRYVTSTTDFAFFSTTDGYSVILTLDEPEQFISAIRSQ